MARAAETGGLPLLIELAAPSVSYLESSRPPIVRDWDARDATREAIQHALDAVDERTRRSSPIDAAVLPDGVGERTAAALRRVPYEVARRALRQLAWVNVVSTRPGLDGTRYQSLDPVREALTPAGSDRALAIARATDAVEAMFRAFAPSPAVPHVLSMLDAAEDEHPNLRYLLADRLEHEPRRALELAIAASEFWASRGFSIEGRRWIEDATMAVYPDGELEVGRHARPGPHHADVP